MLNVNKLPNGLRLTLGNEGRSELAAALRDGYYRGEGLICEWLRDELEVIRPEEIGALTDAPILCECGGIEYSDYGDRQVRDDASVFWFPAYETRDPWSELASKGRVFFSGA